MSNTNSNRYSALVKDEEEVVGSLHTISDNNSLTTTEQQQQLLLNEEASDAIELRRLE